MQPAAHQAHILEIVQEFLEGCWATPPGEADTLRVLNINLPPGAGKSSIISATLPPWVLGRRPFERIGVVSAKGDLATMFETVTKADIEAGDTYRDCFPNDENRPDEARGWSRGALYLKGLPERESTPSLAVSGLFGSVLGKRFTVAILDDAQDQESARTPEQRRKSWEFVDGTVLSRVIPGSPVINVQQRWHDDDLTGQLERHYGARTLSVPAIRQDGRSYWPSMYSRAYLEQRRLSNPALFSANYQQKPVSREGALFDRANFRVVKSVPEGSMRVRRWDLAATQDGGDWTAGILMARTPDGRYVVEHVTRVQAGPGAVEKLILATAQADGRAVKVRLPQDPGQAGKAQAAYLIGRLAGFDVSAEIETGDKVTRATPFAAQVEAGNVDVLEGDWVPEFLAELELFPNGQHDDQVDPSAGAFNELARRTAPVRRPQSLGFTGVS